jgi:LacI family transcriptional regulator
VLVFINAGPAYGRQMIAGIVSYARAHGPWEFVGPVGPASSAAVIQDAPGYDGLIFHPAHRSAVAAALAKGVPAVSVGGDPLSHDIPHVTVDAQAVAAMALDHFRALGFERFAIYGGHPDGRNRRLGPFRRLVESSGWTCVDLGPGMRRRPQSGNARWRDALARLKRSLPGLQPRTAVFVDSSEQARPLIVACQELGRAVPDELAVLGVDDDDELCALSHPPISAIDHGCETIGWEAAKLLDALMRGRKPTARVIQVNPVRVVVRQSTDTLAVDDPLIVAALRFIRAHFPQSITGQDVVHAVGVSRPTLEKHFLHALGRTVSRQLTLIRIEHAKELLRATDLDLAAISSRCGFSYPSKFSTVFRREAGLAPSAYRASRLIRRRL